jgi:hypothetical protein
MKPSYPDRSVFAIPLKDGGPARGVVARSAFGGELLFGYFFDPRLAWMPEVDRSGLEPEKAVLRLRFGDPALFKGVWPVVDKLPDWSPDKWPMSDAVRRDPLGKMKPALVEYDDADPSRILSEETLDNDNGLPLMGWRAIPSWKRKLSKLLA